MKIFLKFTALFVAGAFAFYGFQKSKSKHSPYPFEESSLLWEIEGNGIKKGSHLFGTMHLIEKENFFFPEYLKKIIKSSDQIVMEIAGLPSSAEAMKYIMLSEGNFSDYFTEDQLDSIYTWSQEKMGINKEIFNASFNKMKPFVVVQMATQMQFLGKTESYEIDIEKIAKENEIPIFGLETVEKQMSFFDNMSRERQAEMVMEAIRSNGEEDLISEKMQSLYKRQQIDSLYMLINEKGGSIASEQKVLLDDRNTDWIPKIEAYIKKEKTFIAVGAGHLGGPNGVIRQLEAKGYILKPVKLKK